MTSEHDMDGIEIAQDQAEISVLCLNAGVPISTLKPAAPNETVMARFVFGSHRYIVVKAANGRMVAARFKADSAWTLDAVTEHVREAFGLGNLHSRFTIDKSNLPSMN